MMSSVWPVLAAAWISNGHRGAGAWTAILVVSAAGGLAAGAAALRLKPRRPLLLAAIAVVPNALPAILLALELPGETLVVTALVTGFGNMLFNTLWDTTPQQHIPPASLSRVSAYDWSGSLLCQPLGLALAGVAPAGTGMGRTLRIAAAADLAAAAAMLAAPSVRHPQRLGGPQLEHSAQHFAAD
jgi:hypothetical protein